MNRLVILTLLLTSGIVNAANDFSYPELMVSPRASERLRLEMDRERQGGFFRNHKGLQLSGLITLVAGALQSSNVDTTNDVEENSPKVGMLVGAGWVLTTTLLDMSYRPYETGHRGLGRIKGKSQRDQLTRERLAEEAINNAGALGKRLDYIGVATNFLASAYMMASVKKDTISEAVNILAMVTSITPLIFENYWSDVSKTQNSYKKKVYGPIGFSPVLFDQATKKYVTGANFAFTF